MSTTVLYVARIKSLLQTTILMYPLFFLFNLIVLFLGASFNPYVG